MIALYDFPPFSVGCWTQGILTYRRHTLREFKLKFSPLLKAYDGKYTENSKKRFWIHIVLWSVLPGVIYRRICRNSSFSCTLKSKKTNSSVYEILNESLSSKHLKSYQINPIFLKYREFRESKVQVWDIKSKITSKQATNVFIIIRHYKWENCKIDAGQ